MKETFLIVGIIAAGILMIVLFLNYSPDLLSYKSDEPEKPVVTTQKLPDLHLSIVTSEPDFWDKVHDLNSKKTTVTSSVTAVSLTDENGNEITSVSDTDEENEVTSVTDKDKNNNDKSNKINNKSKKDNPVTTVPD